MNTPDTEPRKLMKLRRDAEGRLKSGAAPVSLGWWMDTGALSSIHHLATSPASAEDALKLLHEVQVYQVELDLQHEEMEATQREIAEQLTHFETLYESAPVAYVTLSAHHEILDCNHAAATLLGSKPEELRSRAISSFVGPLNGAPFQQWLSALRPEGGRARCEARLVGAGGQHPVQVIASISPDGRTILVVIVELPESE
jgi:PAS domain S-box-containing protein